MLRRNYPPENNPFSKPLTQQYGGLRTARDTTMLYTNEQAQRRFEDVPLERSIDFRNHVEKLRLEREAENRKTGGARPPAEADVREQPVPSPFRTSERRWVVALDSGHRDKRLYPDASSFRMFLERVYENVASIELVSIEFPNADSTISLRNNTIAWVNEEDEDIGFPVYRVNLSPATFNTSEALASAMDVALNARPIYRRAGKGTPHRFVIDLTSAGDLVSITSILPISVGNNPITTTANSNVVSLYMEDHGFRTGENVYISGVMGYVGGILSTDMVGFFTVGVIDKDTVTFVTQNPATTSMTGGGPYVYVGKGAPFKLLFGSVDKNLSGILGFPEEDSAEFVNDRSDGPLTSIVLPDKTVTGVQPSIAVIPGQRTQIVCPNHRLLRGERVRLIDVYLKPNIYTDLNPEGIFDVLQVLSPDVFTIDWYSYEVVNVTRGCVGTQIMQLTFPPLDLEKAAANPLLWKKRFNRITKIDEWAPPGWADLGVRFTTLFPHGRRAGDSVNVSGTNCVPIMDGVHVVQYADEDTMVVSGPALNREGYKGILADDYSFTLYGVDATGGFTSADINGRNFIVRDVIDENNFTFSTNSGFAVSSTSGGGRAVRISSKIHGFRPTQTNGLGSIGLAFRPVNLAGNTYCFLTLPMFGRHSTMLYTGPVKNILAKLLLTDTPGNFIFNSAVASPMVFDGGALQRMNELDFLWVDPFGDTLSFSGMEWSCTLAITCKTQTDDRNYQSSVVMLPPLSDNRDPLNIRRAV
jgi:hypothetical protein